MELLFFERASRRACREQKRQTESGNPKQAPRPAGLVLMSLRL